MRLEKPAVVIMNVCMPSLEVMKAAQLSANLD